MYAPHIDAELHAAQQVQRVGQVAAQVDGDSDVSSHLPVVVVAVGISIRDRIALTVHTTIIVFQRVNVLTPQIIVGSYAHAEEKSFLAKLVAYVELCVRAYAVIHLGHIQGRTHKRIPLTAADGYRDIVLHTRTLLIRSLCTGSCR